MSTGKLATRNLAGHPLRTAVFGILTALLSLSLFCGSVVVGSLRNGLDSANARLGADVICIPKTAQSKIDTENLLLTGTTGYYYMSSGNAEKIAALEGVEKVTPQLYLASLRASCCSVAIQVIGIDQDTDFVVQPWIQESYGKKLELGELAVGSRVTSGVGDEIRIYEQNCPVVARLASTGTAMDTAVYCTMDTARMLLEAARNLGHDLQISGDVQDVVSAVYVKVSGDTTAEKVTNDINLHVRKVKASCSKNMITGISDSLDGVSKTISVLTGAVWVLIFVILFLAYTMLTGERKKEFAVLRVIGMSRRMLASTAMTESLLVSLIGGICGMALGALVLFPFTTLIETGIGLPYLLPSVGTIIKTGLMTLLLVLVIGAVSSAFSVLRLSRVDTGVILREAN